MVNISKLFNDFMDLVGLKYYTKNESDGKYALKSEIPSSITIDNSLTESSGNPVQNKVIKNALDNKVDKVTGKGLSTEDYTSSDKTKLGNIEYEANKVTKLSELTDDVGFLTSHQDITGKVNVSDIKDNLTSSDVDKPLSANQGKVLKGLVDGKASSSHSHNTGELVDTSAYTNIGSSANATQKTINSNINAKLGEKAVASNVYSKSETYTQSEITTLISNAVSDLQLFEVVNSLPTNNIKTNRLYLIVNNESITNNLYDIYLRVNNSWEQLDSLEFDISNFYNKTEMDTLLSGKVDTSDSRLTNARTPTSHTHGDITNTGTIGSTANKPLITTTNGKIATGSFGTSANTFCQGNDSRLSNARTPTAHTHGNLQNGGTISVSGTVQKSKNVVTDSNGYITTEAKPTIPTKTSQLTNDSGYLTSHQDITGKLDKAQGTSNASKNVVTDSNGNITVEAKPTIDSALSSTSVNAIQNKVVKSALDGKANSSHSHTEYNKATYSQTLASSTSGAYEIGKITIDGTSTSIYGKDTNTTYSTASTSANGLMSSTDKTNLDNLVSSTATTKNAHTHTKSQITDFPTIPSANATATNIKMDGTQSAGSLTSFAKADHVHPTDTSRVAVSQGTTNSGKFLKVNSSGNVACESVSVSDIPTLTSSKISDLNSVIANAVGSLELFEVVTTLPTTNISNKKLYLVPNSVDGTTNKYDIYLRVNDAWEKIDSLDFNISDYIKKTSSTDLLLANGTTKTQDSFATSTHTHSQYLTSHQDISGKLNTSDFETTLESVIDSLITEAQS